MHDLLAAKDILSAALAAAKEKNIKKIDKIIVEMGQIKLSHIHPDGLEHLEEILPENLKFNLSLLAKNTPAEKAKIEIITSSDSEMRLKEIQGE